MYWGEEHVFAATSEDLVNWTPYVNTDGSLRKLFSPRDGHFDSQLTECGPPAIYTPKGIVLLYNGKNSASRGDKRYTANVYAAGKPSSTPMTRPVSYPSRRTVLPPDG